MVYSSFPDLTASLQQFGLKSFRPGQQEVVTQLLSGQDCLCVMPTGGGKSLCYQLPAIIRPGLTIVVSPLIALMKDQVDALEERGIAATLINSSLSPREQDERLSLVSQGQFKLLYVAPERLQNKRFLEAIRATPVQLLAVDEAHCISEWGHDFRPDYAKIGRFRDWLGGIQTVALTATATARVRQDIIDILKLRTPKEFITGFARTNLHFGVVSCSNDREKDRNLVEFLKTNPGFGIIYAATRKRCESLVETLGKELKISIAAYHAGLTNDERHMVQDRFMKGELQTIVATNAFGMGIDKANLRYVIHYNIPGSMEAYYQEAGRAGRDGLRSQCVLLFSYQDRYIQEFFIDNAHPPAELVRQVYEFLSLRPEDPIELTQQEIRDTLDLPLSAEAVGTSLQILSKTNVLERLEVGGGLAMVRINSDLPTLVDLLPREAKTRRAVLRVVEQAIGDRRHQAVYVHPRWLMQKTEMDRDALSRVLRELSQLKEFEYVPPFRGRAVHFRTRGLPFNELEIDFEALALKKKAEYEKLDHVIAYAQGKQCRQLSIVQYFGDPTAQACGLCDRCQGHHGWPQVPAQSATSDNLPASSTPESQPRANDKVDMPLKCGPVIKRVLAAVHKTHGRLGKNLIVQYLCGSENAKIQRLRLTRLSDFGMLSGLRQTEASNLLEALLTAGLLRQQEINRHRPTVHVSEAGLQFLEADPTPPIHVPIAERLATRLIALRLHQTHATSAPIISTASLPDTRSTPAGSANTKTARNDPPSTLNRPNHADSVTGDSKQTSAAGHTNDNASSEKTASHESTGAKSETPDWQWTIMLVQHGYTLEQCAAIRRKGWEAILDDLTTGAASGKRFDISRLFRDVQIAAAIRDIAQESIATNSPPPVLSRYPAVWRLLRALNGLYNDSGRSPATTPSGTMLGS